MALKSSAGLATRETCHIDLDLAVVLLSGDGIVVPCPGESEADICCLGELLQILDEDGLEELGLLNARSVFCPLGEDVDGIIGADDTLGEDDGEGLVNGVVVPVELSLVNEHCEK